MKQASKKPLISVIIPVYNVAPYLLRCLDSVVSQSYKKLEIIVVDDGSTDESGEICDTYAKNDKRIRVIHKKNGGLSDARNKGIVIANGEFITFIDSDDYVEKNHIETLIFNQCKYNSDIAISAHLVKYPNRVIDTATHTEYEISPKETLERMLYSEGIDLSAWAKLYKAKLFRDIEFPKSRNYEDAATTYRLIDKSNRISVISEPTYNYIIRSDGISQSSFSEKKLDLVISTKEMVDYIAGKYTNLQDACNRRMAYAYLSTITQAVRAKATKPARQLLKELKPYRKSVLLDKRTPKRDKVALIVSYAGVRVFGLIWSAYEKNTKRH